VSFTGTSDVFMLHYVHCFRHPCCIPLPHHSDSTQTDAGFFLTSLQLSSHNPTILQKRKVKDKLNVKVEITNKIVYCSLIIICLFAKTL